MTSVATPVTFDMDAEPALLFPDLTSGGNLKAGGDLTLERNPEWELAGKLRADFKASRV